MTETILMTGVTGFLGRHVLWNLLRRPGVATKVYCLLRPERGLGVEQRLQDLLISDRHPFDPEVLNRCHAVAGDIVEPQLGIEAKIYERLLAEVDCIIHCAATVRFDTSLGQARRINVEGSRRILDLGQTLQNSGRLRRVDYFSTAFVAGTTQGRVYEDALVATRFNNTYEQTKWEAEQIVREAQRGMPITIYRPSIIVGDSETGYTSNFRVLYWPLKVLSSGMVIVVPADRTGVVDVVPIDYVVRAFIALRRSEDTLGKCYHLAAGPVRQSSCGELLEMAAQYFEVREPWMIPPNISYRVVRPLLRSVLWGKRRALLRRGELYFPYFSYRGSFEVANTSADLDAAQIVAPFVKDYFHNIMRFCVESDWGRKALPS